MKVLLVDDNPVIARYLSNVLKGAGIPHDTASSGNEALALFTNNEFGMIVSDIDMPNGNGVFLANQVRQRAPKTILFAFTGSSGDGLREQAIRSFDKVFIKPDQISELVLEIIVRARTDQHVVSSVIQGKKAFTPEISAPISC